MGGWESECEVGFLECQRSVAADVGEWWWGDGREEREDVAAAGLQWMLTLDCSWCYLEQVDVEINRELGKCQVLCIE